MRPRPGADRKPSGRATSYGSESGASRTFRVIFKSMPAGWWSFHDSASTGSLDETGEHLVQRLLEDYRRYLLNPSIEITILRRINILGAVTRPGIYNVDPTVTIADALAMAGGVTTIGNPDNIQILRDGQELTTGVSQRTRIAESPMQSGDQIYVPERGMFSRNTGLYTTLFSAAITLTVALFLR